jgi:hypothetical protein
MNKISQNIPNLIKQPSQCCIYCGKSYKKKTNMDKHTLLCELISDSKKRKNLITEDENMDQDIPSNRKMYQILLELGSRFNKMEEKMDEINKWIIKKKKKINVIEWLNMNMKPEILFDNLIEKIIVTHDDIKYLFEKTFIETLNHIFSKSIYNLINDPNYNIPIFAFVQKTNIFYIYETRESGWIELSKDQLVKFLNKVHMKLFRVFSEYKRLHNEELRNDESFSVLCDKTSVKMMNIDFRQENILGKTKTIMYSKMKTDMKALVEYEFEF